MKSHSGVCIAATDEDRIKLRAIPAGQAVVVKIGKPRNIQHHRKMMTLIQFVARHHPRYRRIPVGPESSPFLALKEALKKVTGHLVRWTDPTTGEVIGERTLSLEFTEMDEGDFIAWAAKAKPFLVILMGELDEKTQARYEDEIDSWTHWCLH